VAQGLNLALFRPAFSSSVYTAGQSDPGGATDGSVANFVPRVFQSDAADGNNPEWFAVSLANPVINPSVEVVTRDCCTQEFEGQLDLYIAEIAGVNMSDALATWTFDSLPAPCGTMQGLTDAGQQSAPCHGRGNVIFLRANQIQVGGTLSLAEVRVFGYEDVGARPVKFYILVDAAHRDATQSALLRLSSSTMLASRLALGSSASVEVHNIVQFSPQFTCDTQLSPCLSNSNCVDMTGGAGYFCECPLDFSGARPACVAPQTGGSGSGDSSTSSTTNLVGSQILLQSLSHSSSGTFIKAEEPGTAGAFGQVTQIDPPDAGLQDFWAFETFVVRDAGSGMVALQTAHNTFLRYGLLQ
jgi:hypothetical protein